jgi:type IV secretion system protein VirB6
MFDAIAGLLVDAGGGLLGKVLHPAGASIADLAYFTLIYEYLHNEIEAFGLNMSRSVTVTAGAIALVIMTIWVFFQGLRFVTGQNRESFMAFLMNAVRALLIVSAAMTFATTNSAIYNFLTETVQGSITRAVTGEDDANPKSMIDKNLAYMQLGLSSIDAVKVVDDPTLYMEKSRDMWMLGVGTAGPAMVGGAMLLMYEVAWALFIGLGPIFILCLLFDATKSMFSRWLMMGIGTMFSMAVLAAMVAIATKTVIAVAGAFWTSALIGKLVLGDSGTFDGGMGSMAMQQGGIGMLLTVLLISTPPMVANFFQGTVGNFLTVAAVSGGEPNRPGRGGGGYGGGNGYGSGAPNEGGGPRGGNNGGSNSPYNQRGTNAQFNDQASRAYRNQASAPRSPSGGGQSGLGSGQRGIANTNAGGNNNTPDT